MQEELFAIGVFIGARGLQGELKLKPLTDHPERFKQLTSGYLVLSGSIREFRINRSRRFKNLQLMRLEGIDTREAAEHLVGTELLIPADELVSLDDDEYFWFDLIGMSVWTEGGTHLGTLEKIIESAANDV